MTARHKHIDPMGGLALLNRRSQARLADDQTCDLGVAYHMALAAMLGGYGTEQAWSTLACAINIALLLAEAGVHPGHTKAQALQIIQDAQAGLMRAGHRGNDHQQWSLGRDAFVLQCAFALHDQQLSDASKGQIVCALEEVHRRITMGETL